MIRPLTMRDLAAASRVHGQSFETGWSEESLKAHIETDVCLGIFKPELMGFIIAKPAADQAEIITIAVSPERRGAGLGGALVAQSCRQLAGLGVEVLFLEVAEDNQPAIALYKACGFSPMGRRPAYYRREGGRVAALTYRKDLSV